MKTGDTLARSRHVDRTLTLLTRGTSMRENIIVQQMTSMFLILLIQVLAINEYMLMLN